MAGIAHFSILVYFRYSHTGAVCSGDWNYYMTESKDYDEMKNTPYESYYLREEGQFIKTYVQTVLTVLAAPLSCFCCVYSVFICNARVSEANIYDIIRSTDMDEAMKTFKEKAEDM